MDQFRRALIKLLLLANVEKEPIELCDVVGMLSNVFFLDFGRDKEVVINFIKYLIESNNFSLSFECNDLLSSNLTVEEQLYYIGERYEVHNHWVYLSYDILFKISPQGRAFIQPYAVIIQTILIAMEDEINKQRRITLSEIVHLLRKKYNIGDLMIISCLIDEILYHLTASNDLILQNDDNFKYILHDEEDKLIDDLTKQNFPEEKTKKIVIQFKKCT